VGSEMCIRDSVSGALFMGQRKKKQEVQDDLEQMDAIAERAQADAKQKFDERLARARDAADASVADRPRTDDPVADLRDRLDR